MDKNITDKIVTQIGKTEIGKEPVLSVEKPVVVPNVPKPDRPTIEEMMPTGGGGGGGSPKPPKEPVMPLIIPVKFSDSSNFDVPAGYCGDAIDEINVTRGVIGNIPPFTYSGVPKFGGRNSVARPWHSWLDITTDGIISGTRPNPPSSEITANILNTDSTAAIQVKDGAGNTAQLVINVGEIMQKGLRQEERPIKKK